MGWINLILPFWKPLAALAVGAFLWWRVDAFIDDYTEMKEAHKREITALTVARNNARIEAESAKATLAEKEAHEERMEFLYTTIITQQDVTQEEKAEQQETFEGHDLEEMAQRHGQWIEKLANRATQERMDAFEDAFNSDRD